MIRVQGASKAFGPVQAYRDISLEVARGQMFGIIGPDGAGKTTLIRSLVSLLHPDAGTIEVLGHSTSTQARAIRSQVGYMPQRFSLYQDLSVQQNLHFFAGLFGIPRSQREERLRELYRFSRLETFRHRRAGALSGGMKQKLALSCNLIHRPSLLILDEPTFGVDPVSREEFWQLLAQIRTEGATIVCSTPYMDEAERFDRLVFLHQGRLVASGSPDEVRATYPYPLYRVTGGKLRQLHGWMARQDGVVAVQLFGGELHVAFASQPNDWQRWQQAAPGGIESWEPVRPSVEDVFLWRMGGEHGA